MNKSKFAFFKGKNWVELVAAVFLLALFAAPFVGLAGTKKFFVDDDASGTQDGSASHPFKTIKQALKKADEGDEVHILPGTYKENIEIPEDVEVFGSDKEKVIIKADDDDDPVVKMKHKTELNKVTVKDGKVGIEVGTNDRVSIVECIIKDNDKDGIRVKEGDVKDKKKVSITESIIKDNGWAGIYSKKRRIVIIENEIHDNDKGGVILEAGSKAWIEKNRIKDNDGSGLKLILDGSEIWTDDNSFSDNEREGVEINAYGGSGRIDLHDSSIHGNDRWGVARVQRGSFAASVWNGLTIRPDNRLYDNKFGNVSNIVRIK